MSLVIVETDTGEEYEIVLCQDCKHYEPNTNGHGQCRIHFMSGWEDNDYCSRGERKDD